jgi:hypothetical protein
LFWISFGGIAALDLLAEPKNPTNEFAVALLADSPNRWQALQK